MNDRSGVQGPASRVAVTAISAYQRWITPATAARCRFLPTCSAYAAEAIGLHGLARGTVLAVARIGRCHPLHAGGYDPVPRPASPTPVATGAGR